MKFPKTKRFLSERNLESVRNQPCIACGKAPRSTPDHIRTRGGGGGDELTNLWPLCIPCHGLKGAVGIKTFAEKFKLKISFDEGYPKRSDLPGMA